MYFFNVICWDCIIHLLYIFEFNLWKGLPHLLPPGSVLLVTILFVLLHFLFYRNIVFNSFLRQSCVPFILSKLRSIFWPRLTKVCAMAKAFWATCLFSQMNLVVFFLPALAKFSADCSCPPKLPALAQQSLLPRILSSCMDCISSQG